MQANSNQSGEKNLSRRQWLKLASTSAMAAGIAGCMTQSGDSDDGGSESASMDSVYSTYTREGVLPNELQWNTYNTQNNSWIVNKFFFDKLGIKRLDGEYVPSLAKSWEVTEEKMTLTLQDDAQWHDGEPVTASHVKDKMDIELGMGSTASDFIDGATVVDEQTVELSLPEPVNSDLLKTVILSLRINTPPTSRFSDFAQQFRDADDDATKEEIASEVSGYQLTDPVGNGPFTLEETSPQRVQGEKHEGHHFADQVNVPEFEGLSQVGGQPHTAMRNDNIDGVTGGADPQVADQFPDNIRNDQIPRVGGYGFLLNFDHHYFEDYRARQAMCWLHDPEHTQSGDANPDTLITPPPIGHNYPDRLSEDVRNNLNQYNEGPNEEKATALFQEAGFTKEDSNWYDPNGDRFTIVLENTGDPTFQTPFQIQLEDFGIQTEIDTKSETVWAEDFFNGDFQVFVNWWGQSPGAAHPWKQMQWEWAPNSSQYPEAMGKNLESLSVPMPVGDPDGTAEEVNVLERFRQYSSAVEEEEAQEHLDFLSWAWNQSGCSPQIWTQGSNHWADTGDWNWPSSEEIQQGAREPYADGWRTGRLSAKTE